MKPPIVFEDFIKLDLRVGLVEEATFVEGSEKLIKMRVRFGKMKESPGNSDQHTPLSKHTPAPTSPPLSRGESGLSREGNVDNFQESSDVRTIFAGLRQWYEPKDLVGKKFGFVYNLAPKKMMGEESQGMMLAVGSVGERPYLWPVPDEVEVGAVVR